MEEWEPVFGFSRYDISTYEGPGWVFITNR